MKSKSIAVFILLIGLFIVVMAVFARSLGIDHNEGWGRGRLILLFVGLGTFLIGAILNFSERFPLLRAIRENDDFAFLTRLGHDYLSLLPVVLVILVIYIWYISAGLWTTWPARTEYYALLARAFEGGNLHLPITPSEKLLALDDPYDPGQRQGVGEPLDISLYKGKFYLYWGPVPAFLLVAVKLIIARDLADLYLVFGFSCGLFLLQTLFIIVVWDRYYSTLPRWILVMSVLLIGLSGPLVWVLCTGEIYEAAIVGGQFFMLAGFLTALSALNGSSINLKVLATGVLWALAIGTRLTLILPIGFMGLMTLYGLWRNSSFRLPSVAQKALYLGLPLLLGSILLAWYNGARFGSLSETGFRYALAGTNIQRNQKDVASYRYLVQNFYNYLLAPPQLNKEWPYLYSNEGSIEPVLSFYQLPGLYNTNLITGLPYVVPFVFFSLCHVPIRKENKKRWTIYEKPRADLVWIVVTLSGAGLIALLFLFLFFWAAMRYMVDFSLMLLLVSLIGYYRCYLAASEKGLQKYVAVMGIAIASVSILMSLTLAFSGNIVLFQQVNPDLLKWFARLDILSN